MSSTNRGGQRSTADVYNTPPWCLHRFLDEYHRPAEVDPWPNLPGGRWLEPCAGDGEIIRTINSRRSDIQWSACELREEMRPVLRPLVPPTTSSGPNFLIMGDLLEVRLEDFGGKKFDVAITNPPFRIALPIVKKCMELAKMTVMLLRLNFWGSDERQEFMARFPPTTLVLPNRPMFALNKEGKPGSDSPEYAFMVWYGPESYDSAVNLGGIIKVLKRTPKAERKAWTEHIKRRAPAPVAAGLDIDSAPAASPFGPDRDL